ncbi:MAG: hypothetical protein ACYCWW_11915 [Deltaproteobacteria bacterium]
MPTKLRPLLLLLALVSCANVPRTGDPEALGHQAELYFKAIRWKDFVAAAAFLPPDKRAEWRRETIRRHDERDLSITAYDVEETRLTKSGGRTFVKVSWVRLPSISEQTDLVELRWRYVEGAWQLTDEIGGPIGRPPPKSTSTVEP